MDISPDILAKLLVLGQSKLLSDGFSTLLQRVYDDLVNCFSNTTAGSTLPPKTSSGNDVTLLNEAHSTISMLILECEKNSIGQDVLKCNLEDCLWPQSMIDTFLHFYSANHISQLKMLQHIQSGFPKLLDASWKLDYYVKNKDIEQVCNLSFQISLLTGSIGKSELEPISFSCNFEELQDLVAKFRDATKSIEKLSQT